MRHIVVLYDCPRDLTYRGNNPFIKYINMATATVYSQDFILISLLFPYTK